VKGVLVYPAGTESRTVQSQPIVRKSLIDIYVNLVWCKMYLDENAVLCKMYFTVELVIDCKVLFNEIKEKQE